MITKINGIHGWYFPEEVNKAANENGELLTLDFEYGDSCPLRCIYCYRSEDQRDGREELLNFNQWKKVIDDAKSIGLKSIKLIGGGEITQEKGFLEAIDYIVNKDIIVVLFTSGTTLGDNRLCQRLLGMSSNKFAHWLYDRNMSIFIKVDSFNHELQDRIAGKPGYTEVRNRALDLLLSLDFINHNPTRLGLEVNVSSYNYHEIMNIYSLRAKYNIYEDVVISMPCDMYFKNKDYDITLEQKQELYRRIYNFNIEHNIPFNEVSPFMGGLICEQLCNGLYISNRGQVFHCPGSFDILGNVKNDSLVRIWENFLVKKELYEGYFCPFRENTDIIPTKLVNEIRREFCFEENLCCK